MSNIDKQAVTAKTKELSSLMVERFSMNPVSCKLLNEAWEKEFPDEVTIAKRMLALLDELEVVNELFLRAKALMYQSGGTPIENSLNPIDAWLYDAERAAAAGKGE